MECKVAVWSVKGEARQDLIETLWNVKNQVFAIDSRRVCDLIETLWNVKLIKTICDYYARKRFNRDIVECKGAYAAADSAIGKKI